MFRSPFFLLLFLVFVFSCTEKTKNNTLLIKGNSEEAYATRQKAIDYFVNKKYDSAFNYFNESKIQFEKVKDSSNISYCLIQMTGIQQMFGDYVGSEETSTEALRYNVPEHKASIYNSLGIASKELTNYDDAIARYTIALKSTIKPFDKQSPLNNIAAVYIQKEEYDKAIKILESILNAHLFDENAFLSKKARVIDNLGFAYYKANDERKGLDLMNNALVLKLKIDDTYGSIESYLHLADYYHDKKNLQKSEEYALKAYVSATKNKSIDERLEALGYLMQHSSSRNNFVTQFIRLNDSIKTVRNRAKNQFAKIRYDTRIAREENLKLKNQKIAIDLALQKSENEINIWISGAAVLVSVIIFLFYHFKNKRKEDRLKASYQTETRIAKKVHDELANDVFHTMSYAETKPLHDPRYKEELINLLDGIYQRSRNISKENDTIETGEKFESFLIEMLNSYKEDNRQVIIKTSNPVNWTKISDEKKITAYRALQELMVNMKKHSKANVVIIGFDEGRREITLEYTDNGIGIVNDQIKKSGLQNVENRIKAVDGTLTFEIINKGCKIKINFPK